MHINNLDAHWNESVGLWLTALFQGLNEFNPEFTYEDQKEAFFWLIEKWLREKRIRFLNPNRRGVSPEIEQRYPIYWNAAPNEIVDAFRKGWPKNVTSADDYDINLFLYSMPNVIWILPDGDEIISS